MPAKIYLTNHAKDRLRERHDRHLLPYTNIDEFNASCYELLNVQAKFTNRHLNDTAFMMYYQEKYGFEKKYQFKEYKNALFVIADDRVVTVLDTDQHRSSRQFGRQKKF